MAVTAQPVRATTTTTAETTEQTTTTTQVEKTSSYSVEKFLINSGMKGTYYTAGGCGHSVPCKGGSDRTLIDCNYGNGEVKGSVACRYVWSNYGYNYNGKRTMVYLEVNERPDMNGYYYVDDCCGSYSVVDFYYDYGSNCPFQY